VKKSLAILLVGSALSGCVSNKALDVIAQPTNYDGFWAANGGGHVINWYIRPDGTGVQCEVNSLTLTGSPLVFDLKIIDQTVYVNNTYKLKRSSRDSFNAATWGGVFSLDFKRQKYSPAACKPYF